MVFWLVVLAVAGIVWWLGQWARSWHDDADRRQPCPWCGQPVPVPVFVPDVPVLCPSCRRYGMLEQRRLIAMPRDRVIPKHLFRAELPAAAIAWPPTCCLCERPPVRADPMTRELFLEHPRSVKEMTITVPHCADHRDGAVIDTAEGTRFCVAFRSHAYFLEFIALNRTRACFR